MNQNRELVIFTWISDWFSFLFIVKFPHLIFFKCDITNWASLSEIYFSNGESCKPISWNLKCDYYWSEFVDVFYHLFICVVKYQNRGGAFVIPLTGLTSVLPRPTLCLSETKIWISNVTCCQQLRYFMYRIRWF